VTFPEDYKSTFVKYHAMNFPATKQVRHFYTAMAREAGWGKDFPDMLRNEDWNYAAFSADRKHRPINQAECLACHKPLDKDSYAFTMKQIADAAKAR